LEARAGGAVHRIVGFLYTLGRLLPVKRFTGWRWNGEASLISKKEQPSSIQTMGLPIWQCPYEEGNGIEN